MKQTIFILFTFFSIQLHAIDSLQLDSLDRIAKNDLLQDSVRISALLKISDLHSQSRKFKECIESIKQAFILIEEKLPYSHYLRGQVFSRFGLNYAINGESSAD